jgi:beta-1,4-mannosyl-glycoprotein beta-1,4-N-acetylglucosaminyltransferase
MIYDCFTFFNELDLLEIRLNELDLVVDRFVLVEATKTHQGKEKPLHFQENKARYQKFLAKIIHVVVDTYPGYQGKSAWILEHHQRNMIMKGLEGCKPGDVILISDVDEIPRPEKITAYRDSIGIKIFRQRMFYYYLNCVNAGVNQSNYNNWYGTVMVNYSPNLIPQDLRTLQMTLMGNSFRTSFSRRFEGWLWKVKNVYLKGKILRYIDNGGWHFSYLGGVEKIIYKLEAFAHAEFNKEKFKDAQKIEDAIQNGKDIFGRNLSYKYISIDPSYPKYITDNLEKFAFLIKV